MKIVSTVVSSSSLPIFLLPESIEIHLVFRSNIDSCRAVLFRLTGALASVGYLLLFKLFSLGYFNIFLDYFKFS